MAERFPDFQVEEIQELKENSENQNTKKSTSTWLNVWTSWAESKNFETNLLSYEAKQLDETLQKFFAEFRKKDGSEYEHKINGWRYKKFLMWQYKQIIA